MIACYDLARCPPTYDAVAFLALAEQERLRRGEEYLDIRILPGPADGFRFDSLWPHTVGERVRMRDRVLVPLCRLLPSVRSVEVVEGGRAGHDTCGCWGAGEYLIGLPRIVEALRAGSRPLRGVKFPLARRRDLVTFTLREAEHWPLRNSRTDEWFAAADILVARGLKVMVIRDTARAGAGKSDGAALASHDLEYRAMLYSLAGLNVGICNGPMWMSIFMDAPTLMLRPTTNAAGGCYDDAFYAQFGLPRGSQLPTSPPHQRLAWKEDTKENIVMSVEEMLDV